MGTSRLTYSDRCYAPGLSGVKEKEEGTEQSDVEITISKKKGKESLNEPITKTEANEFLKFIKHNEYSIVEQLHKLPAKIFTSTDAAFGASQRSHAESPETSLRTLQCPD